MAAAASWRTDGTQHEPGMLIELRGGAIWCFSAPHRPICFSPSLALRQPPGRCSTMRPGRGARGAVTSAGASEGGGMCRQGTAGSAGSEGGCGGRVTGHVGAATTA
jgi:hypothetical protein